MKGLTIVGALQLLATCALLAVVALAVRPAARGAERWEYRLEFHPDAELARTANRLGANGWEIADVRRARDDEDRFGTEIIWRRRVAADVTTEAVPPVPATPPVPRERRCDLPNGTFVTVPPGGDCRAVGGVDVGEVPRAPRAP